MSSAKAPLDASAVDEHLARLCKPPGSLGDLESIAKRLCLIQQTLAPRTRPRQATVFAADHGVVAEGVTAWPSEVTAAVTAVMGDARTASGVFAQELGCQYEVVDVGLLSAVSPERACLNAAGRRGTANLLREPAMHDADFEHAWQVGRQRASRAAEQGARLLIGGEMGIGNTTAATCLIALLCKPATDIRTLVGRGAGASDEQLAKKQRVVAAAIERVRGLGVQDARALACQAGGLEIVALAGFYAEGARSGCVLLIDGLIAASAAVLADAISPGARDGMIAGHRSTEPAQALALAHLKLEPLLNLQMRLGEATGALAALPLLDLAAAMTREMATLDELNLP